MTLDSQAQTVLDLAEKSDRPPLESLDPVAARIQYAEMVEAALGDTPAGVVTQDLSIPVQGGEIPAGIRLGSRSAATARAAHWPPSRATWPSGTTDRGSPTSSSSIRRRNSGAPCRHTRRWARDTD